MEKKRKKRKRNHQIQSNVYHHMFEEQSSQVIKHSLSPDLNPTKHLQEILDRQYFPPLILQFFYDRYDNPLNTFNNFPKLLTQFAQHPSV